MNVGDKVNLRTNPLTRSQSMKGTGTVTAVKVTDPVNHRGLVIIRTAAGYLHFPNADV